MPANDFEKQVQDKMEELKLRPAEPVWEKIEKAISKKKRKKRFLFLLPLMAGLLLLGYTGYRFFMPPADRFKAGEDTKSITEIKKSDTIDKESNNKKVTGTISIPAATLPDQQNIVPIERELTSDRTSSERGIVKAKLREVEKKVMKNSDMQMLNPGASLNKKPAGDSNIQGFKNDSPAIHLAGQNKEVIKADDRVVKVKKGRSGNDSVAAQQNLAVIKPKEKVTDISAGISYPGDSKTEAIAQQKITKPKVTKDSRLGLSFSAGISDIRKKVLSFSRSSLQTADYGSVLSGSPGTINPPVSASETRPGLAIKLGLTWEKSIARRSKFSTGLQYAYFSDRINVGERTNAILQLSNAYLFGQTVNGYYAATQQKNFTNRYHFIELPVGYQLQFNKNRNIPFTWNIGVSMSRLITTNALVYDTARGGIYYHSRELFNKTHFSMLSGLSLRFSNRKGIVWSIGPQWSIDMTRTVKEGFDKSRYLLAGYLEARLLFPGKIKK